MSNELTKEDRWKKLMEPKQEIYSQREKTKSQIEIEEIKKNCPFQP
jgi:hypothetical protein